MSLPSHIFLTATSRRTRRWPTTSETHDISAPTVIAVPRVSWAVLTTDDYPRTLRVPCVVPQYMLFPLRIKAHFRVHHLLSSVIVQTQYSHFLRYSITYLSGWVQADPFAPAPGFQAISCFFAGHCSERQYAYWAIAFFQATFAKPAHFFIR